MSKLSLESTLKTTHITRSQKVRLVLSMSIPGILAQLTSIAMQYIDAGMVGSLGAEATAAIGLMSSTTWLINGSCIGIAAGFYVQVAQMIGAGKQKEAANVLRQGLKMVLFAGLLLSLLTGSLSSSLPRWLGGDEAILSDASRYFLIFCLTIPFSLLRQLTAGMMQATGDMKTPSLCATIVCILDVIFNSLLIFPTRSIALAGTMITLPGAGLGVTGAALGTAFADVVVSLASLFILGTRNQKIALTSKGEWRFRRHTLSNAARIAIPMSLDQIFLCSAYVAGTFLVAKLGTVAVAANSLAITAESLCYMPGYGIGAAATAIIGQTIGAGRRDLTRSFSRLSVYLGMIFMGLTAIIMWLAAPSVFRLLTGDKAVIALGSKVLRMELIAEPLYGASICCAGVFRGAGDTLMPSILNLVSMWGVRIGLSSLLIPRMGLEGYWTAMAIELAFRGTIFLIRLYRGKWMKRSLA